MIKKLIAESGSTKTEWRLIDNKSVIQEYRSAGFNPNVQTEESMRETLQDVVYHFGAGNISEFYFYGAGLAEISQREIILNLVKTLLPKAIVHIEHDMLAAVRSTLRSEGIVCILGTGSNSAWFQNEEIRMNLGGHGYLIGDEGSGCYIGKHLLRAILQEDLPKEARHYLEDEEKMDISAIKLSIFKAEKPNVRMASLARHAGALLHLEGIQELVKKCFLDFLDSTVVRYPNYQNQYTNFVGSISFYFKHELMKACEERGVKLGEINKDPVDNLIKYHLGVRL